VSLSAPLQPGADAADALIGTRVDDRYVIARLHSRGGMSVVYAALHEQQQREVAIKVLDEAIASDAEAVERFMYEARTASSLSHGHIVGVSDFGRLPDGRPYLVMPLLAGTDMATLLAQEGPQPPQRVAALLAGVGSALDAMHAMGFVHRDIKSENLMHIRGEDGTETVLVLDLGIAAVRQHGRRGKADDASGTPEFMAPEVLAGDSGDHRSDVYSLATVAFELISGALPFDGEDLPELLKNKAAGRPRTLSEAADASFPPALENVLARGLARDPKRRQPSPGQFMRELRTASAGLSSSPVKAGARKPAPPRSRTLVGTGNAARADAALPANLRVRRSTHRGGYQPEPAVEEVERTGTHRRLQPAKADGSAPATGSTKSPASVTAPAGGKTAAAVSAKLAAARRAKAESAKTLMEGVRMQPRGMAPPPVVAPPPVAPESQRPPSGAWPTAEDSLQPPPELDIALEAEARGLRGRLSNLHWLAYPTLAALVGLGIMVFDRLRPVSAPAKAVPAIAAPVRPEPASVAASPSGAQDALDAPPSAAPVAPVAPSNTAAPGVEPQPVEAPAPPVEAVPRVVAPSATEAARPSRVKAPRATAAKPRKSRAAAAETVSASPAAKPEAAPAAEPGRAAALTQKATDAMLRGDFAAADAAYQQAIAADPRHAAALRGRGLLLERMDRPKDAARAFRQFLKLNPDAPGSDKIRARLAALEPSP
jgi:eukaryotic-like serine/threonine-protein kinase